MAEATAAVTFVAQPGKDTVAVTAYTPDVYTLTDRTTASITFVAQPGRDTVAVTGYVPITPSNITLEPASDSLTVTGYAPGFAGDSGVTLEPAAGTMAVTGYAPAIARSDTGVWVAEPGHDTVVLTEYAPVLHTRLYPAADTLTVTGRSTNVITGEYPAPGDQTLYVTGYAPTLLTTIPVAPDALAVTGYVPVVSESTGSVEVDVVAQPAAGTVTMTGYSPALIRSDIGQWVAEPGKDTVAVTGYAPSLAWTSSVPDRYQMIVTGYAPLVINGLQPAADTVSVTGYAPAIGLGLNPDADSLVITGYQLEAAGGDVVVRPPSVPMTITGHEPMVVNGINVGAGSITVTGSDGPVSAIGRLIDADVVAITGYAATLKTTLRPANDTIRFIGQVPDIQGIETSHGGANMWRRRRRRR